MTAPGIAVRASEGRALWPDRPGGAICAAVRDAMACRPSPALRPIGHEVPRRGWNHGGAA